MFYDEFTPGYTMTLAPALIDREEMLAFARRYDNVPLHTDETYASATRFGGLIAPGMYSFLTVWARYLEQDLFGTELVAGCSTKIEWLAPVYPGDLLTGQVTVTDLHKRGAHTGAVELTIRATNGAGLCVMTAVTEAVVLTQ